MHSGSCLCGAVRFEIQGDLPAAEACHCTKCRKVSGHFYAGVDIPRDALEISGAEHITWYHSSARERGGFCKVCGSNLFFDPLTQTPWTAVALGAFDTPTGTHIAKHIFTAFKGDYYDIGDDAPQYETYPGRSPQD